MGLTGVPDGGPRPHGGAADWHGWHHEYDQPGSRLAARLDVVRGRIRTALDDAPAGPIQAISLCAGQGRDLLGVLTEHPRRRDVTARLVELDQRNVDIARDAVDAADLTGVEVEAGDAALVDRYAGAVPADLVLLCGIFGNVTDADVYRTVAHAGQLCRPGATVIWTRHRDPPDLIPRICDWFGEHQFDQVWVSDPAAGYGVGVHRFAGATSPLTPGIRLFTFLPHG